MKKFNIMAVLLLFSISVLAIVPPDNVQATFKKMYPKTNDCLPFRKFYHSHIFRNPTCIRTKCKSIIDHRCQPIETDKISLRHFPLSLRIEPYIFGETVHYKVGLRKM